MKKISSFLRTFYSKALEHKKLSLFIIISIVSLGYYFYSKQSTTTTSYQYTMVKRGSLTSSVSGTGQVISQSQVDLKPKVNANVTSVYVKAGDRVKSGQVLFRLDATDAYKQVRDAKTALESANIALEKLRNPKTIDVMSITNSIKQEEDSKKNEDTKVKNAYTTLLTSNLLAYPEGDFTTETAPTLTGSYTKGIEGQIKISVYQGGNSGYSFSLSGIASGGGDVNTNVAQPLGDTGLYIKWSGTTHQTNWTIDIPNKQSTSYSSNLIAWQNAITSRDTNNQASDRNIASLKQKLADLTPSDDNLDVQSAKIQVEQRENALLDAQTSLSNYTITAPFDGVMANVSVDIGSSAVMASSNSSSALGTIVTDKKMAQITVNESDIVKIKLGQKAKITFDAISGLELEGNIVEINTLGTVTSGVVTYKAKIAFSTDDARILPNMSVSVDVITDSKDDVLYIPTQALKHDTAGYYVEKNTSMTGFNSASSSRRFGNASSSIERNFDGAMATSSGYRNINGSSTRRRASSTDSTGQTNTAVTITRIPVTIGTQNDTQTEITSGLQEGERIILKKTTTTTTKGSAAAPSVTSLLRPQGGARPTGAMGGANRGQ
jgi:HlyD family secretion protein